MKIWAFTCHHGCIYLQVQQDALCYAADLLSGQVTVFDINHQQNTRGRPNWNSKTIMQTAPSYLAVYQWLRLPFLKKYSIKCEKFRLWIVYSRQTSQRLIIFHYHADNIHIVLENDNTVLIKGLKKVVILNSRNTPSRNVLWLKSREITFDNTGKSLAKAGVFRWVTNIHEHKRYYYTFDNSLLFTESIETLHKITAKS